MLYKEQSGGAPLWMETQNIQADKNGHYSVMLGSATSHGLPAEAFAAGEARWLGVQPSGQAEQPRTLLLSVPYALKALDAETLGGKPASAFMSAPSSGAGAGAGSRQEGPQVEQKNEIVCSSTTNCKTGFVPLFSTNGGSAQVTDSIVSQSGTNIAIAGTQSVTSSASTPAILGTSTGSAGTSNGVQGVTGSATASGVAGVNTSGIGVYGSSSGSSATSAGVWGQTSSGAGAGVEGVNTSTAANATGIYGYSPSFGVIGSSPLVGVDGSSSNTSGPGIGVQGLASSTGSGSAGVYGQLVSPIVSNFGSWQPPAGVWGSTGVSGPAGVLGTADESPAGLFLNSSHIGYSTVQALAFDSFGYPFSGWNMSNGTGCWIDQGGNINCTGQKHAIVPIDGGKRKVAMSSIEAPQSWFEDAGSSHLANGAAIVSLDPDFIQTVNTEMEYNVFLTPYGDCKGLYVTNRTAKSFEVHELGGGTASLSFGYRIMALRRKYENVRFEDHTKDPDPKAMLEHMGKAKPASSFDPASVKPALQPAAGLPVAQLTKK
jgi:hypothetical protein